VILDLHAAQAHGELARSDPPADAIIETAPARVTLWFTEAPELRFSEIQVLDRAGRRVDAGSLRDDATDRLALSIGLQATAPGTYTVLWKALSAVDGHVTRGAFGFTVGLDQTPTGLLVDAEEGGPPTTPDRVVVRILTYIGLAGLLGAFPFVHWVLLPACAASSLPPATVARMLRSIWTLAGIAAGGALLASVGALVSQAAAAFDVSFIEAIGGPAGSLAISTRFGVLWWLRTACLLGLSGIVLRARRGPTAGATGLACWLGLALLLVQALGSHSAATQGATGTAVVLDWIHLAAVVTWTGGLAHLLLTLWALRRSGPGEAMRAAAKLVPRFSVVGILGVGALVLSGIYQSWLLVGSQAALTETPYGQALLVKLALVVPLVVLGVINLIVLRSRLLPTGNLRSTHTDLRPLRRTVAGETALAIAVLAVAGLLTNLQPGREALQVQGVTVSATAEDVHATLRLQPGLAGLNRFDVGLADRSGHPILDAETVALRFTMLSMDMGESELIAYPQRNGHYVAQGGPLAMAGAWRAELLVRRTGRDDVRSEAELAVGNPPSFGSAPTTAPAAEGRLLLGIEFLVLAAAAFLYAIWMAPGQARVLRLILPAGAAAVLAGSLMAGSGAAALRAAATVRNPIAPTAASVARGGAIYAERCAVCHGESGRGDGPAAIGATRPADIRQHLAAGHTDTQLFDWLSNGFPGTTMPAFSSELGEEDRWNVLNYIQQSFGPGRS
jgi:copper transport protein